ncbi:MAG: fumarylacetoacetate hydrolase family protein [Deltaproteobacteria bacterium]|nr:fumarylacetoacetate hydrolase family protein [Deltaproteobacteria bacterium]NNK07702.1 2-keto-4-pentenoate hydratase [Myxococcales bacterium]RZV49691.1 MAG: 2-keto-4-pentenoate hydratase [Deltaproteobacteria bacterium]
MAHLLETERQIAESIRMARESCSPIAPIGGALAPQDLRAAYRIQALNAEAWMRAGRSRTGRKVGLTSNAVQKQLGVDQPDSGVLLDSMAIPDGGRVDPARCMQPKVEAEIAFLLDREIDAELLKRGRIADAIALAYPAIEICDSAIADWRIGIVDTIADNASSGFYVIGESGVPLEAFDPQACTMTMEVNGAVVSTGTGEACLGNPLNALRWLAETTLGQGDPLQAGELVLSGALGPMAPVAPGDMVRAEIEGLGSVSVSFGE